MMQLPQAATSVNEQALASWRRERFTGLTTTALTLTSMPRRTVTDEGLELVFKFVAATGAWVVLDPNGGAAGYTIAGKDITLGAAAAAGDIFLVWYPYRED